jgi:hypothetical protein
MNLDDPKLTAFALEELTEPERTTIARAIADSPEAQQFVDETRKFAQALKNEFTAELSQVEAAPRTSRSGGFPAADFAKGRSGNRRSLIDIHDDPLFWSVARPLAIAAVIAIFAIVGATMIATSKSRSNPNTAAGINADVEAEEMAQAEAPSEFRGPDSVPNPLRTELIQRVERVVIGELDPYVENGEIRMIEVINDAYRLQGLKKRLTTPVLSKKSHRGVVGRAYELMFLDQNGRVIASAAFYRTSSFGVILQPSKYGYERYGHYFARRGDAVLPGDWESDVDYSGYGIPFPDWKEYVGQSPGA